MKKCEKARKVCKIMKRFCPLVVALWFFPEGVRLLRAPGKSLDVLEFPSASPEVPQ